jgi:Sap, sulfolipid-1-addressing protein
MPTQALAWALAASIYPPAVAAVIALGRSDQVRSRVFAFVLAALLATYATGAVMLFALEELGATNTASHSASAGIDLAIGVLLMALALQLYSRRPHAAARPVPSGAQPETAGALPATTATPSKIQRYLESRRLAFVLGITLYVLPSPIYIAAVKSIADAKLSTSSELLALVATVAVMLWMIELPMLMLLAIPERASDALERINLWFSRHGRLVASVVSAGAGVYLALDGLAGLVG